MKLVTNKIDNSWKFCIFLSTDGITSEKSIIYYYLPTIVVNTTVKHWRPISPHCMLMAVSGQTQKQ